MSGNTTPPVDPLLTSRDLVALLDAPGHLSLDQAENGPPGSHDGLNSRGWRCRPGDRPGGINA